MIVEIDDGADLGKVLERVNVRGLKMSPADPVFQAAHKTPLVEEVARKFHCGRAGGEVDWGRDGAQARQKLSPLRAEFAREFQRDIASERESGEEQRCSADSFSLA